MSEIVRNVFAGMGVTAAAITLAVLVGILVYTFLDDVTKLEKGTIEAAAILAVLAMLIGGVVSAVIGYFG